MAYSPLGRGFLTGTVPNLEVLGPKDRRRDMPRFQGDNLGHNLRLVEALKAVAAQESCTPAQAAIAWLLTKNDFIAPLPGTKQRRWLEENAEAAGLAISPDTIAALDEAFAPGVAAGTRYPEPQMRRLGI